MADPQNNAADTTSLPVQGSESSQPATFQVPEGKFLADRAEYERNMNRLRGQDQQFQEFSKFGIKSPKDFEPHHKFSEFLKSRKMTHDQIMAAFAENGQDESAPVKPDMGEVEKFVRDKGFVGRDDLDSEFTTREALSEHKTSIGREKDLLAKALESALPDTADQWAKKALGAEVRARMADPANRPMYPEGHPLCPKYDDKGNLLNPKAQLAPWGEKDIAKLVLDAKKELALEDGADMANIGRKAAQSRPPTGAPAGNRSGQGKPVDDEPNASGSGRIKAATEKWAKSAGLS